MYDLQLAVNLAGWRVFTRRKQDKAFLPVEKRILERDHYTCQFCGFQAKEYQEVVNIDGNYLNNKYSNLATACCFCVQCLFIQAAGMDEMSGGQLIYLPEMSQADLNSFCHVLFCAMDNNTGYQDISQTLFRSFRFRAQTVEQKLGTGMSNPAILGQVLLEYQAQHPDDKKNEILKELRLLPSNSKFKVQLDAWAAAAVQELEADHTQED